MAKFSFSLWALFLVVLASAFVFAEEQKQADAINVEVIAEFPDNPFGLIVNGQRNKVVLTLNNKDTRDVAVLAVSGQMALVEDTSRVIQNLTGLRYGMQVAPEEKVDVPFQFYSEFNPGDLSLTVFVDLLVGEEMVRIVGYNGVVTITDPETSLLDPQLLFLYLVLAAAAGGVLYLIREAFFGGATKKATVTKKKEVVEKAAHRDDKGNMVLDESWIPGHHLKSSPSQSPRAKKRSTRK
ncbi:hypothetical protein DM01DRAFT_1382738 [Hesseltinella vesiculosa]|uniref:Uncharacterized protein n=1 Tax=Hesseltinella vesiculosa TaxID=101127 RepID=A0A1X2GJZ8_9FUNG|nr:hypothetical protein DM01DRAFT_1382738 [Hesseltinella vesiculosa]